MVEISTMRDNSDVDSLLQISMRFCIKNPQAFCEYNQSEACYKLQRDLALSETICEPMLTLCTDLLKESHFESFVNIFKDTKRTRLRLVDLSNSDLTDDVLDSLCNHRITELNISGCKRLTLDALNSIAKLTRLRKLIIGSSYAYMCQAEPTRLRRSPSKPVPDFIRMKFLRVLVIHGDHPWSFEHRLSPLSTVFLARRLAHLDLSGCKIDSKQMKAIHGRSLDLVSLSLRNAGNISHLLDDICGFESLRKLDISYHRLTGQLYDHPHETLERIVTSLENLESLDISGTNLAGARVQDVHPWDLAGVRVHDVYLGEDDVTETDIPGLASRVNKPLEYLGLFRSAYWPCVRSRIPAKKIGGHANIEQCLTSMEMYYTCELSMQRLLPVFWDKLPCIPYEDIPRGLDLVMKVMRQHFENSIIQEFGISFVGFFVDVRKDLLNTKMKRKILHLFIDSLNFQERVHLYRHLLGKLLYIFTISNLFCDIERLMKILVIVISEDYTDYLTRTGMSLISGVLREIESDSGNERVEERWQLLRDVELILALLKLVTLRLQRSFNGLDVKGAQCDDFMRDAWKIMLTLTDKSQSDCAKFIKEKGGNLCLFYLNAFQGETELILNILKLLKNVAQVDDPKCKKFVRRRAVLRIMSRLLRHPNNEVSITASTIISHVQSIVGELAAERYFHALCKFIEDVEEENLNVSFVPPYDALNRFLLEEEELIQRRRRESIEEEEEPIEDWNLKTLPVPFVVRLERFPQEGGTTYNLMTLSFHSFNILDRFLEEE